MEAGSVILLIWTIASGNGGMAKVLSENLTVFEVRFESIAKCQAVAQEIRMQENWNRSGPILKETGNGEGHEFDKDFYIEMRTNCVSLDMNEGGPIIQAHDP